MRYGLVAVILVGLVRAPQVEVVKVQSPAVTVSKVERTTVPNPSVALTVPVILVPRTPAEIWDGMDKSILMSQFSIDYETYWGYRFRTATNFSMLLGLARELKTELPSGRTNDVGSR